MDKVKIAVIYYSKYNHTHVIAERLAKGAKAEGAEVQLFHVGQTLSTPEELEQLHAYDAMIFGSPTYMGSISSELKRFMEMTVKIWVSQKWRNKIAAGFSNSMGMSGDKLCTIFSLATFAAQHGMIWVGNTAMAEGHDANPPGVVNRIGSWFGLMTQANNEPSDTAPPEVDRLTAEYFGARIAQITKQFKKGAAV